jgi:hypothetical protein
MADRHFLQIAAKLNAAARNHYAIKRKSAACWPGYKHRIRLTSPPVQEPENWALAIGRPYLQTFLLIAELDGKRFRVDAAVANFDNGVLLAFCVPSAECITHGLK